MTPKSIRERIEVKKPRVRFCWECGKKLYGNHHRVRIVDAHERILHKQCAERIDEGFRGLAEGEGE